ncbi:hypothetical protein ACQ4LE_003990 [Meloidogyne hapla]
MFLPSTGCFFQKSKAEMKFLRAKYYGLERRSSDSDISNVFPNRIKILTPVDEKEFKHGTPDLFIEKAKQYRDDSPPALIQSAKNLWLGAVYSIKIIFLNYNLNIVSHEALKVFCYFAINTSSKIFSKIAMADKWKLAVKLRSYSVGSKYLDETKFDNYMEHVIQFIQTFKEINLNEIEKNLEKILSKPKDFKIKEVEDHEILIGGNNYTYNKIIY